MAPTQAATSTNAAPTLTTVPSATPAVVAGNDAEVLFPMLVRFSILLRLSVTNVKSAQVHITQGEVIDQTIDVPLTEKGNFKTINDQASEGFYAWPLNEQNAPTPFTMITYAWTVTSGSGQTYKASGVVPYRDLNHNWKNTSIDPMRIYTHDDNLAIELIYNNVKRAYDLIQRNTAVSHTFTVIAYDLGASPCQDDPQHPGQKVLIAKDQTVFACDPAQASKVYGARGFIFVQRTTPSLEGLEDQLVGIIAADAYDTLWKSAAETPPSWLRGGLMQWYNLTGHAYSLLLARDAARSDQLLSLDALNVPPVANPKDNGASLRAWNAQSYMLTLYLAARFGASAPTDIAKQIGQNGKFADVIGGLAPGVTPQSLYVDWQNWLLLPDADNAIAWNVFIKDNTSTPTETPTDFPTLTPTSDIPTATETPFQLNTKTPTAPPTAIPASNTPLPPGSLATLTPVPTK